MRQQAFALLCACIITCSGAFSSVVAQGTAITYGVSQGTYQEITGGNLLATGSELQGYAGTVLLPFTYSWAGEDYTEVEVFGRSGAVRFGTETIYAWVTHLSAMVNGTLRTQTLGTAPNRTVVIQWRNATRAPHGSSQDQYNMQVRINEGGSVDVVYGAMTVTAYMQPVIGATSASNSIFLQASYWHSSWMMPTVQTTETACEVIAGWTPSSGLTYTFRAAAAVDASVVAVSSPTGTFDAGQPVTVKAMVMNRGTTPLTSVQVAWSISGVAQPTITYDANPALQQGDMIEVQLGSFTPAATSFNTVTISTTNPNGGADDVPGNDAMVAYLAPRVNGLLNVIQNGAAGAFTSVSAGIRHLANSGLKGDVRLRIFGTEYDEQIIVPDIPESDYTITLFAAEGYTPNFTYHPSNQPGAGLLDNVEQGMYQVYIVGEHAHLVLEDLRFSLPEEGLWGGHVCAGDAKGLTIRNCSFVGVDDYANAVPGVASLMILRTPFTFHNSSIRNVEMAIEVDNDEEAVLIDSSQFASIGYGAIRVIGQNLTVHANQITSDSTSSAFNGISAIGAGTVSANTVTAHRGSVEGSRVAGIGVLSLDGFAGGDHGIDVYNNMISVSGTELTFGLAVLPSSAIDHTRIVFNTVVASGTAPIHRSAALTIGREFFPGTSQQEEEFTLLNNILTNTSEPGGYAVINEFDYATISDYNNLMTTGALIGRFNQTDVARDTTGHPLTSWRAATGRDINSSSVAVSFVGENDLHLAEISTSLLGASSGMDFVRTDIDGQERLAPYMGADEAIPVPVITKQPLGRYACIGEEMQFSIEVTVPEGASVTYQWYRDGRPIVSATGPILQFTFVTFSVSGVYSCEVIATDGFHTERVMSEPATLFVVRPTEVIDQPVSQPAAPGSTVSFEVIADAIGSPFTFSSRYQWKKRYWDPSAQAYVDTNVVDNDRISGATSSRLTIRDVEMVDTSDTYVCEVIGYCGTVDSREARLFFPKVLLSLNTPRVCEGDSIAIECAVIPQLVQGSTVTLAWFMNGTALVDDGRITGSTSKFLVVRNASQQDRGQYHCVATYTGVGTSVSSDTIGVGIAELPQITVQPSGDTVCVGDSVRFEVQANGNDLSYQWVIGSTNIPGATERILDLVNLRTTFSGTYAVKVTNYCGVSTSEEFELLVIRAPRITKQPEDITVFDGDVVRFTVETDEQEPLTYQWFRNDSLVDSAGSATYEVEAGITGEQAGEYYCVVSNVCGSDTSAVATASITVGVQETDLLPGGYRCGVPQPNPAMDAFRLSYALPSSQHVQISIVNTIGAEVATLLDAPMDAGGHTVEVDLRSLNVAPGMYLVNFQAGGVRTARTVMIVR